MLNLLFCFLKKEDKEILQKIENLFPDKKIYFTDMGRSAFRLIIEALNLKNSEMLVPAYTCDVFLPLFEKYNIAPVFLDIEKETFNINCQKIESKITPKTKSILVSHTYGLPSDLAVILNLAKKYNLKVIEDCAHGLGATYNGMALGNFGEASFFSLYKLFPALRGGAAILPLKTREIKLSETNFSFRDFVSLLNCFSFFSFLFKKYGSEIAQKNIRKEKACLYRNFNEYDKNSDTKKGGRGKLVFPVAEILKPQGFKEHNARAERALMFRAAQINRVSLNIFAWQMAKLEIILKQRQKLGSLLQQELKKLGFETQNQGGNIFTLLSALVPENLDRNKLVIALRKKRVFLTRIWHSPIVLNPATQKKYKIDLNQFPNTLETAKRIVNFPLQNFYTKKDVEKIISAVKLTLPKG